MDMCFNTIAKRYNVFKKIDKIFFTTILIISIISASANADTTKRIPEEKLHEILKIIEIEFGKVETLKTYFIQEKHLSLFSDVIISRGYCFYKKPGSIRLDFNSPYKSSLMVMDKSVSKFEFLDGRWQK